MNKRTPSRWWSLRCNGSQSSLNRILWVGVLNMFVQSAKINSAE